MQTVIPGYPGKGSDCNGCGICCIAEQCRVSVEQFGLAQVCPALEFKDTRYWCGLMVSPGRYDAEMFPSDFSDEIQGGAYQILIGAGRGCDSEGDFNGNTNPET
jgi:hypothetical protein